MKQFLLSIIAMFLFQFAGCSSTGSQPQTGTVGFLKSGDQPLAEFEVRVFKAGDSTPFALGVTSLDGKFALSLADGSGACWLSTGDYLVVLESIGPAVVKLPQAYRDPLKTPLKITWRSDDPHLNLTIPALKN